MLPEFSGNQFQPKIQETERKAFYKPEGSIIPMVTPAITNKSGEVAPDPEGMRNLTENIIKGMEGYPGGIFILGSIGEFRSMSVRQKIEAIRISAEIINKRIPLVVGVSAPTLRETRTLAQVASSCEATALVMVPYYGEGKPSEKLAAVSNQLTPVILYNNPGIHTGNFAGIDLPIETIEKIRKSYPSIVGIKNTTQNIEHTKRLMTMEGLKVFFGIPPSSSLDWASASGGVFSFGNVYPRETAYLISQVRKDQTDQEAINQMHALQEGLTNTIGVKNRLHNLGIIPSPITF